MRLYNLLDKEQSRKLPWLTIFTIPLITCFTYWRLIDEGLYNHLFDYGKEALHAVQAWENHGFLSMAGMFSWGQGYIPTDAEPTRIYQSKTPLHLLHLWGAYKLVGTTGYPAFKLAYSLAIASLNGILLSAIAYICLQRTSKGITQSIYNELIIIGTYSITISNESILRFCMIDEPDYLSITFWLATTASLGLWLQSPEAKSIPKLTIILGFLTSWIYPIFGVTNAITLATLQLFNIESKFKHALRRLIPGSVAGITLYWLQRTIAKALIPEKLYGSKLMDRMGMTGSLEAHDGLFDALDFIYDQRPGGVPGFLRDSQIYIEHCAVWILGIIFFFILIARLNGLNKQALLALTAGGSWLLIPLLSQSVAQHGWVYGINFVPTIVLGWIGALSNVLPGKRSKIFGPAMIGFVPLLLWAIQLRWFMALYLR